MLALKREFYYNLRNIENYKEICKLQSLYFQHGTTTVLKHCRNVAYYSLLIAKKLDERFNISFNYNNLIIGAFLHDLFLYDWHEKDKSHRMHGFTHAKTALNNAKRDFKINKTEEDMIYSHMFPLNLFRFPKTKEGKILCLADKICAVYETMPVDPLKILVNESLNQSKVHN